MSVKKCPKCGSVWYSALTKCAFCGVEGEVHEMPILTGKVHGERASESKAQHAAAPEESPVAVAEATPVPPTHSDPVPPPVPESPPEVKSEPTPEVKVEEKLSEAPRAESLAPPTPAPTRPAAHLPPAPYLPSAFVPVVFGWMGIAAFLLLPAAIYLRADRVASILALLAYGVLAPFAPFAWLAGRRYEDRCQAMGFQPARSGRTGRQLGTLGTFVLVFQAALLGILVAVLHLSGKLPDLSGK